MREALIDTCLFAEGEAYRHRCGARSSKPVEGREVFGRFDSYTLPPHPLKSHLSRTNFPRLLVFAVRLCHWPDMSSEHATLLLPNCLDGVDLLHASYRTQNFSRHSHDCYALGAIEEGALGFRYLNRDHVACKGDVNLVVPGECHDGHAACASGWTYRMLYLSTDLVADAASELNLDLPDFQDGVLRDRALAEEIRSVHICLAHAETCLLEKESRLLRLLTRWIHRHAEHRGTLAPAGAEHAAIRRVKDYLRDRIDHNPSLADMARAACLSPFHLLRVFTKATGQSPHDYLTQLRVNRAKILLPSQLSLARIAAECGFADQSHLTRLFRRQCGLTPGKYRKIVQNSRHRQA